MTSPYRTTGRDVNSFFCSMKNAMLYRAVRPESSREASERFLMETLGRSQSEPRRRLALASGFALFRSFGIDRLDELGSGARVGRPRWLRILTITGGSSMPVLTARISLKPARLTRK